MVVTVITGERLTDQETDAIMTDTDTQPDLEGNLKYEGKVRAVYSELPDIISCLFFNVGGVLVVFNHVAYLTFN